MWGQVTKNIAEYMNSASQKHFTHITVNAIVNSIREERADRKSKGIKINTKTKAGKMKINERTANIANTKLNINTLTASDIRLYKRCFAEEYTNRTGKCAWGFKNTRKRLGFDPDTGLEIS